MKKQTCKGICLKIKTWNLVSEQFVRLLTVLRGSFNVVLYIITYYYTVIKRSIH